MLGETEAVYSGFTFLTVVWKMHDMTPPAPSKKKITSWLLVYHESVYPVSKKDTELEGDWNIGDH